MKSTSLLVAAALAIVLPLSAHAAKDPAKKEERKAARQALSQYDKNSNGTIDADEVEALQKGFEADKTGPLKQFDLNADGKLDDKEISAIHAGKKGDKAGGKKKKNV